MQKDQSEWYIYAENIRWLVTIRELVFVIMKIVTVLKFRFNLCSIQNRSCFRLVNGIEKYVTETTETILKSKQKLELNNQKR